jgi:hypothetical protein
MKESLYYEYHLFFISLLITLSPHRRIYQSPRAGG